MMTVDDFKYLVGRTIEAAVPELPPRYFIFVADEDGQSFYRTQEFNPYRINVWVKRGVINKIDGVN